MRWPVVEKVIELKTKCSYRRKPICPRGQLHHFIWQRCSAPSINANHSKLRGNHCHFKTPPPQCFVPLLWCTLIQNRTMKLGTDSSARLSSYTKQCTTAKRSKFENLCPVIMGCVSWNMPFFFCPHGDLQESYELTRHFNYSQWELKLCPGLPACL